MDRIISSLLISAAHKSSGKTMITLGLCAALTKRGRVVQPFKKGPDYIDPLWLSQAAQRSCHNLDFYTMNPNEIVRNVACHSQGADVSLIEGNKGLFDGLDVEGHHSNAALAHLLGVPVILVLDTQGMTRGVVPLILGYQFFNQQYDKKIDIAGVILNRVGGQRHENKLRNAIEHYTDMKVLGAVYKDPGLSIEERHLGLIPSNEINQSYEQIDKIGKLVEKQVNLEQVLEISQRVFPFLTLCPPERASPKDITIGVIRDAAFGFYYPGDLMALQQAGAKLIFINALEDAQLPQVDALLIGGGFPEAFMQKLAKNKLLKQAIKHAIERGMPVYAECGGLMYLSRQITWQKHTYEMVGALPCDTVMESRPQGRGYVRLRETGQGLWPLYDAQGQLAEFHAHEFHYSKVINLPSDLQFSYEVLRGYGLDGHHDGIVYKNTLASYVHLRDVENNHWAQRFVAFIRTKKFNSSIERNLCLK